MIVGGSGGEGLCETKGDFSWELFSFLKFWGGGG